ncbi:MAG: NAD(P)-dependent glycerol-3-phosphate dehydrogenase [Spirochaetales bacterium]|jgi:glycerol-3-phosphate dehydrogenase (NAD(P)+)|nr:NAD(P)-dependent glycerol-3-phosphate dehydrogenase [Spirochaetales bacterium]
MVKNSVGILGAGAWGTALGKTLAEKGFPVQLWSFEKNVADDINNSHKNEKYLPGVSGLPANLTASTDIREAADDKEFLIIAIPSLFILSSIKNILTVPNVMEGRSLIGIVTKGFITTEAGPRLIAAALEDYLPGFYKNNLVYIAGPSHAEEVGRGKLTGLISASSNAKNSIRFRELLSGPVLMVYSSLDIVGVQVCAAMKNVIAVAFGMLDALKDLTPYVGDNTESLLLAAGLSEIQSFGQAIGATHAETFSSIAGVGDLDVTCRSQWGRNRRFGREIVLKKIIEKYKDIDDVIAHLGEIGYLPEGAVACRAVNTLAASKGIKLRITQSVYRILNREIDPMMMIGEMAKDVTRAVN